MPSAHLWCERRWCCEVVLRLGYTLTVHIFFHTSATSLLFRKAFAPLPQLSFWRLWQTTQACLRSWSLGSFDIGHLYTLKHTENSLCLKLLYVTPIKLAALPSSQILFYTWHAISREFGISGASEINFRVQFLLQFLGSLVARHSSSWGSRRSRPSTVRNSMALDLVYWHASIVPKNRYIQCFRWAGWWCRVEGRNRLSNQDSDSLLLSYSVGKHFFSTLIHNDYSGCLNCRCRNSLWYSFILQKKQLSSYFFNECLYSHTQIFALTYRTISTATSAVLT